jgi:NAD(P)-dependent dehydrogenase (short-subunit alcohol dehydrogenase family)
MSSIKNVVLIGASGNLGPHILEEFLKSSFNVTVLSREDSKSTFPSGAKVVKTDYSPESLAQAFKNQDAVVSIVGTGGFADQTKIIDAAVNAGVKRFIPSEFGSNTDNPEVRAIVPIFNGKKQVVDYLRTKESGTFSWTALITGPFFDWVSLSFFSVSVFT